MGGASIHRGMATAVDRAAAGLADPAARRGVVAGHRAVIAGWHQRAAQLPACIIRPASADLMLGDPVQQFADPDRGVFARTVTMHERSMVRGRTGRQRKGVHNGVPEGLRFRDGTTVSVNATNIRVRCHALPQKP